MKDTPVDTRPSLFVASSKAKKSSIIMSSGASSVAGGESIVPVTMILFAAASDISLLGPAVVKGRGVVAHCPQHTPSHHSEDAHGAGDKTAVSVPPIAHPEDHQNWRFVPLHQHSVVAAAEANCSDPGALQRAEELAAALGAVSVLRREMKLHTRWVSPDKDCASKGRRRHTSDEGRIGAGVAASCEARRPTPLFLAASSTAAAHAGDSPCVDTSFLWSESGIASSTLHCPSSTLAHVSSTEDAGASDDDVRKRFCSQIRSRSVLCVDVGGVYSLAPPALPFSEPFKAPLPSPAHHQKSLPRSSLTSTAQTKQNPLRSCVPLHPHTSAPGRQMESSRKVATSFDAALRQRFSNAQASCPHEAGVRGAMAVTEVWVIPLPLSGTSHWPTKALLPLDHFPEFKMEDEAPRHASAASFSESRIPAEVPRSVARIVRYPADLRLHLPLDGAVPTVAGRKRPREAELSVDSLNSSLGEKPARPHVSSTQLCSPTAPPFQLRVLESSFLTHSCYFSKWCCAEDFDVTQAYFANTADGNAREQEERGVRTAFAADSHVHTYHAFYAALQRAIAEEESEIRAAVTSTWYGLDGESCIPATDFTERVPQAGAWNRWDGEMLHRGHTTSSADQLPANDLFDDGGNQDAVPAQPVWSVDVLWKLWMRLGWTPPRRQGTFLAELDAFDTLLSPTAGQRTQQRRHRLTPSDWESFLTQCSDQLDDAHVRSVLTRLHQVEEQHVCVQGTGSNATAQGKWDRHHRDLAQSSPCGIEELDVMHRWLTFRAALLDRGEVASASNTRLGSCRSTEGASLENNSGALKEVERTRGVACRSADAAPLCVGPAAQALAADIAATTHFAAGGFSTATRDAAPLELFTHEFALGVLESPALPLSLLEENVSGGLSLPDVGEDAASTESGLSLGSSPNISASALNAVLRRQPCDASQARRVFVCEDGSGATRAVPLSITEEKDQEEMFCEVVDMAEVQWQACLGTPDLNTLRGKTHDACCRCCCCLLVSRQAALLRRSASEQKTEMRTPTTLVGDNIDATSRWLGTAFESFLNRNGRPIEPLSDAAAAAPPPPQAERTVGTSCATAITGGLNVAASLPCGDALTALCTNIIVRCVQQNKAVVRRLMHLVQSYDGAACAKHGEHDVEDGEDDQHAVSEPTCETSKAAQACSIWRCLSGVEPRTVQGEGDDCAVCAREIALRQLRSFWASVAAITRQTVFQKSCALPSNQAKAVLVDRIPSAEREEDAVRVTIGSDDNTEARAAPARGSRSAAPLQGDEIVAYRESATAATAAAPTLEHDMVVLEGARSEEGNMSEKAAGTLHCTSVASRAAHTATALPLPFPDVEKANSSDAVQLQLQQQDSIAFQAAARALDGKRAMQLYMQHVLRCRAGPDAAASLRGPKQANQDVVPENNRVHLPAAASTAAKVLEGTQPDEGALALDGLLLPNLWLRHALFIMSYGGSGSTGVSALPVAQLNVKTPTVQRVARPSVSNSTSHVQFSCLVSPTLATFRALRGGKLTLDAWVLAALEEYADRWQRAARCTMTQ